MLLVFTQVNALVVAVYDRIEQIITRNLLYSQYGQPTVRIATHSSPPLHAAAVTSLDGNITLWPNVANTAVQPLQLRVPGTVTAVGPLVPCTVQGAASLVMLVGTSDGLVHAVHVTPTTHSASVDVLQPAPSPAPQAGIMGALVRGLSRALAPIPPDRPSGQPAVHLSTLVCNGKLLALTATASTLELWTIDVDLGLASPHPVTCVALAPELPARCALIAASDAVLDGEVLQIAVVLANAGQELSIASLALLQDGGLHVEGTVPVPGAGPQPKPGLALANATTAVTWTRGGAATVFDMAAGACT